MRNFVSLLLLIATASLTFSQTKPKIEKKSTTVKPSQIAVTQDGKIVELKGDGTWTYSKDVGSVSNPETSKTVTSFQPVIGKEIIVKGIGFTIASISKETNYNSSLISRLTFNFIIRNISNDGEISFRSQSRIKEDSEHFEGRGYSYSELSTRSKMLKGAVVNSDVSINLTTSENGKDIQIIPKKIVINIQITDNTKPTNGYSDATNKFVLEINESILSQYISEKGLIDNAPKKSASELRLELIGNQQYIAEAEIAYRKNKFDEAIRVSQSVIDSKPTASPNEMNGFAYFIIGKSQMKKGEIDEAIKSLKTSLSLIPTNIEALILLTKVSLERKDCGQAQKYLSSAIATNQLHPEMIGLQRQIKSCLGTSSNDKKPVSGKEQDN